MSDLWLEGYFLYWESESSEFINIENVTMRAGWLTAASECCVGVYQHLDILTSSSIGRAVGCLVKKRVFS